MMTSLRRLFDDPSKTYDVSGGWHDAGDYGRYVVAGAKTVQDLMLAYEDYGIANDDMNIPESGNGVPDILDEARYELDWMLKMQEPSNGGVYHKVSGLNFPETVMPEEEPKLEVRIVSDRMSVRRSWSRVKAEMDFEVQLVDPEHNRRPYFRKNYRLSAESVQRRKDEVPACVYSCIQNLARSFLEDVSKDSLVIARLKALGGD